MVTCAFPHCPDDAVRDQLCSQHLRKNWGSVVKLRALLKGEICVECESQQTRDAVIVDEDGDALCRTCWEQLNQRAPKRLLATKSQSRGTNV